MIKNIIFDIGNVLTDFCWEEYIHKFGFTAEIEKRLANATVLSESWNEFDRGEIDDETILDHFIENDAEIEKEIRMFWKNINGILKSRDYVIPWIKQLKSEGYNVFYLSNFPKKAELECEGILDFLSYMDGGILSYKEKLIKPEPEIYERLMERYGLVGKESVFLDDKEENCNAASKLGMFTIVFTSKKDAEQKLNKIIESI